MRSSRAFAAGLGLAALVALLVSAAQGPRNTLGGDTAIITVPAKNVRSYYGTAQLAPTPTFATATVLLDAGVAATGGLIVTDIVADLGGGNPPGWYGELLENGAVKARLGYAWLGAPPIVETSSEHFASGIPVAPGSRLEFRFLGSVAGTTVDVTVSGFVW